MNSTATYFENDRILLEEAVVGNQPMSVTIQEGQYGLLWIHSTNLYVKVFNQMFPGFTIMSVTLKDDVI